MDMLTKVMALELGPHKVGLLGCPHHWVPGAPQPTVLSPPSLHRSV